MLYKAFVHVVLDYGPVVRSHFTEIDIRQLDQVQNRFLSFVCYFLNVSHSVHDYTHLNQILKLDFFFMRDVRNLIINVFKELLRVKLILERL